MGLTFRFRMQPSEFREALDQDPFDRMLVAQEICENLIPVSHDRKLEPYSVRVLWT